MAVPLRRPVPATTKRFRLTCRNQHRMSQASTVPGIPQSLCDAFELTREGSDGDIRAQLDVQHSEGDATSSVVGVDVVHGDGGPRFEPCMPA